MIDLKGRWEKDVIKLNPDLVSVLIGAMTDELKMVRSISERGKPTIAMC